MMTITDYDQIPAEQIPEALGEIATVQARLLQRLLIPVNGEEPSTDRDFNLTPDDVANRLGKTRRWVYRHGKELGGKHLGHRTLRFSEAGVRRYLACR